MKIVSFDFDYTITTESSGIEFLAQKIGIAEKINKIETMFLNGQINTKEFSDQTACFFRGINKNVIHKLIKNIPTLQCMPEAISLLQSKGYTCIINTLTYDFIVEPFQYMYKIPFTTGVQMGYDKKGVLTGEILKYFTPEDKVQSLRKWEFEQKKAIKYLIAIGDSSGDIPIFKYADYSIALNKCPEELINIADIHLESKNALDIANLILKINK